MSKNKELVWEIRDEETGELIAREPYKKYRDIDEVYEDFDYLPDAFTVELVEK